MKNYQVGTILKSKLPVPETNNQFLNIQVIGEAVKIGRSFSQLVKHIGEKIEGERIGWEHYKPITYLNKNFNIR